MTVSRSAQLRATLQQYGVEQLDACIADIEAIFAPKRRKPPETTRQRTALEMELTELQEFFSKMTNLPEPAKGDRYAPVRWYQPIRNIQRTCNGKSMACIEKAVERLRAKRLTIACPQSIEKTAIAVYGELQSGVGAGAAMGSGNAGFDAAMRFIERLEDGE